MWEVYGLFVRALACPPAAYIHMCPLLFAVRIIVLDSYIFRYDTHYVLAMVHVRAPANGRTAPMF